MKIKPIFAWYDLWIGFYWDRKANKLYFLPVPMLGVVLDFSKEDIDPKVNLWETGCGYSVKDPKPPKDIELL